MITPYLELCKSRIALFASFSGATSFLLAAGAFREEVLVLAAGIFVLACGASALNQFLDRHLDAAMPRTAGRPLPGGRVTAGSALVFSVLLALLGLFALVLSGSPSAPVWGIVALLWYNGLYSFLKMKSAFAVIPGALVGTVPVFMGWTAGGGALDQPAAFALAFFFFMWQIPHSWLFLVQHGHEYESAGLPSLTRYLRRDQLERITAVWICGAAVSCGMIAAAGVVTHRAAQAGLVLLSAWLIASGLALLRDNAGSGPAFRKINLYVLLVMLLLSTDKVV